MLSNYHTHSHYCDGKGELRDYVQLALANGFAALGFSGHAPLPFKNNFSIHDEDYLAYCNEVRALKEEYSHRIDIRLGLEIDYVPGVNDNFQPLIQQGGLDYCIGGVHLVTDPNDTEWLHDHPAEAAERIWFIDGPRQETYDEGLQRVFHGDIRLGVTSFFHQSNAMIESQHPTIVAHFNKIVMHNRDRYFLETDKWYLDLVYETIELIREVGCIVEVNTRGIYKKRHDDFYPSRQLLRHMADKHIPVIISTDAHCPDDLLKTEGAEEYLRAIRYPEIVSILP
ncbi:MAG: histidinol-phosphatase [Bacteroidales bacterium]|nr:histidinol-phosphatase [Bacteroidales bacterium]